MKKIAELTYQSPKSVFLRIKKVLDGYVFWREEGDVIVFKFGSEKLEKYFINLIKN